MATDSGGLLRGSRSGRQKQEKIEDSKQKAEGRKQNPRVRHDVDRLPCLRNFSFRSLQFHLDSAMPFV